MNEPKKIKLPDVLLNREFKFVVTILLSMLAFTLFARTPDRIHELCVMGMFFSTIGDLCLMDRRGVPSCIFNGKQFYAGMAAFVVAHICYRQMFRALTPETNFFDVGDVVSAAIMLMAFIVAYNTEFKKKSKWFFAASGFYTGIILSCLAAAINCAVAVGGRTILAMVGVICFIISDVFLFVREARNDTPLVRKLVWVFYPLAQILIIVNV